MMLFDSVAKRLRDISIAVAVMGVLAASETTSAAMTTSNGGFFRSLETSHASALPATPDALGFDGLRAYMARLDGELKAVRRVLDVIRGDRSLTSSCNDYLIRLDAILSEAIDPPGLLSSRVPALISKLSTIRRVLLDGAPDARTWSRLAQAFTDERWVKLPDRFIGPPWSQRSEVDVEAIMSGARLRALEF